MPDAEYDAALSRLQELVDDHGEQVRVALEVDGELEVRSAAAHLEELDALEDTLERIRACSVPPRRTA